MAKKNNKSRTLALQSMEIVAEMKDTSTASNSSPDADQLNEENLRLKAGR